jgi:hypothetical protein
MQQPAFRGSMLYATATEFNDTEECIDSVVQSSDLWWNEQISEMYSVIATKILAPSIATAAAWSYDCPFIQLF